MADWVTITAADFVAEGFNSDERAKLQSAAGGDDGLAAILLSAIAEWRGVIQAADQQLDADPAKIPPSCRRHIIAQARWQVLIKFPALRQLQTEERKAAADRAEDVLKEIAAGERAVEAPGDPDEDTAGGAWGSETKVNMRTHIEPSN